MPSRREDVDRTDSVLKIVVVILIISSYRLLASKRDFPQTELAQSQVEKFEQDLKLVLFKHIESSNEKVDQTSPLHPLGWFQSHMIHEKLSESYHASLDENGNRTLAVANYNIDKREFVQTCYESLTSREATKDGYINTNDVYNFVSEVDIASDNYTSYDGINICIQVEWIRALCAESWENVKCYQDLETMFIETDSYGFQLQQSSQDQHFQAMHDFCGKIFLCLDVKGDYDTCGFVDPLHEFHHLLS